MKIVELRAENFKRLRAVRIRPDGTLALITGRNAQGKSSVLDAVWAALGGKEAVPGKPIRKGSERAEIMLDLGDIRVRRRFTSDDNSSLVVENADGLRFTSPQSILDGLWERMAFDPLAFSRMTGDKQAATLRKLVKLDVSKLDAKRKTAYEERTNVHRDVKRAQAQLDGMAAVEAPAEPISIADLTKRHAEAVRERDGNAEQRRGVERLATKVTTAKSRVETAQSALDRAKAAVVAAEEALGREQKLVTDMEAAHANAVKLAASLNDPDVAAIAAELEAAESINEAVRRAKLRADKVAELERFKAEAARLDAEIEAVDVEKSKALASVHFPIYGLGIDGEMVTMNGLPIDQASSAEQLRVGLAIGGAMNPKLRVVLVRDGSLLDEDGLRIVAEWAEKSNMQVLMERVADGKTIGIVIEDGEVLGAAKEADENAA